MQLLRHVVREDWRELTQEIRQENLRLWRGLQGLVVLSTLLAVLVTLLGPPQPWGQVGRTVVSSSLFIGFSLWAVLRREEHGCRYAALATILLAGAAVVGGHVRPSPGVEQGFVRNTLTVAGGLVMASSWVILARPHARQREEAERLGVATGGWTANVLLGGVTGGALGTHLILAGYYGGLETGPHPGWATVTWYTFFWIGLRSLGEELLLRGLGFHLLRDGLDRNLWATAVPLTLLNLLTYLGAGSAVWNSSATLWLLPYVAAMGVLNVVLREWRRSLVPALVCHVCFNMVVLLGVGYAI